jgi:lysozyme
VASDIQMTPGNRDPNRYAKKTTLSAAIVAMIAASSAVVGVYSNNDDEPDAATIALYEQFLNEKEGNKLVAYRDGEGLATVCRGLTRIDGRAVVLGERVSTEHCAELNRAHVIDALKQMRTLVGDTWKTMSPAARVGTSSFCITNIGPTKCAPSTFMRELRAGHRNEACAAITLWIKDAGRDCRKAGSNCQGQPVRRMQEDEMCLTQIAQ